MRYLLVLTLLGLLAPSVSAQRPWTEYPDQQLFGSRSYDNFANWVSLDGDVALVGAPKENSSRGAAYLFRYNAVDERWEQEDRVQPSAADSGDQTGRYVSLYGDTAILGAFRDDPRGSNSGSAYIYRYDPSGGDWDLEEKLIPSDGSSGDHFGRHVDIYKDVAVVGANLDNDNGWDSGSAYVFRYDPGREEWREEAKLKPADGAVEDHFGEMIAITDDMVIIGAHFNDAIGVRSGAAYVFKYDRASGTWFEDQKLLGHDTEGDDYFGEAISVSGGVALITALYDKDAAWNAGAAYVFRYDPNIEKWVEEDKLVAPDGDHIDRFGYGADIEGDVAVVGAHFDDDLGNDSGSAYLFVRDPGTGSWDEVAKLLPLDGESGDHYGRNLSVSQGRLLVGSHQNDSNANNAGAAYVHNLFSVTSAPQPPAAGSTATFTASGGAALEATFFYYTRFGLGSTFIPSLNVGLELASAATAGSSVRSDADGTATFVVSIPSRIAGRKLWLQFAQDDWTSHVVAAEMQ